METCYYHPDAKAKSQCPECTMPICDRCRLDGDMQRCAACAEIVAQGGHAGPPMGGNMDYEQPMCTNHATLAADMQCLNCFRPFCLSCASTGYCPDCAPQFVSKQGAAQYASQAAAPAPQYDYAPAEMGYGETYDQVGYTDPGVGGGFDLAGSYLDDGPPAPSPPPRPRKPAGASGAKKGGTGNMAGGGGKKKAPAKKGGGSKPPIGAIVGLLVVLGLAGGGYYAYSNGMIPVGNAGGGEEAANFPTKVSITSPKGTKVAGGQVIKLKVASEDMVERVELTVDGKYWGKFKEPPFESDWPTSLLPNGKHKVSVKVFYQGGKSAADKREYDVQNKL
jgi:hypothetical protein